jgi:hypothetical protein
MKRLVSKLISNMYVHISLESRKSLFWVLSYFVAKNITGKSSSAVENETSEMEALIRSDFTHISALEILM